jgi:hypothetical protein
MKQAEPAQGEHAEAASLREALPPDWALGRARIGERVVAAALALLAGTLLTVAALTPPADAGIGTHTRLGLPPCHFHQTTGLPCPSCGMTTAFSAFVHGDLPGALRAQVMGTMLAAVCLLLALGGLFVAVAGVSLAPLVKYLFLWNHTFIYWLIALAAGSWIFKAILVRTTA